MPVKIMAGNVFAYTYAYAYSDSSALSFDSIKVSTSTTKKIFALLVSVFMLVLCTSWVKLYHNCAWAACAYVVVSETNIIVQLQNSSTVDPVDNTSEFEKKTIELKFIIDKVKSPEYYDMLIFGTSHKVMRCSCSGEVSLGKMKRWKQDWKAWVKMKSINWPLQDCQSKREHRG